jgi:molybdate transport system substrate-binding protein
MPRFRFLVAILVALLALPLGAQARIPVAVAAAADLRGTLEELKAAFESAHPDSELRLTFGASGSLTAQIQQGAPFDVFLSADLGYPESLVRAGLGDGDGVFPYATGRLVLWVRKDLGLDPVRTGLKTLQESAVKRIALANPAVAPYGRAGEAALKGAGLLEALKARLVFGENIAQAAQYLQTGAAEAGLVSVSQASQPALRDQGYVWTIPPEFYPPLRQGGVVLRRSAVAAQAQAFRAFLLGAAGQTILGRHGFGKP